MICQDDEETGQASGRWNSLFPAYLRIPPFLCLGFASEGAFIIPGALVPESSQYGYPKQIPRGSQTENVS